MPPKHVVVAVAAVLCLYVISQIVTSKFSFVSCSAIAFILTVPNQPVATNRLASLQNQLREQSIVSTAVYGELASHAEKRAHLLMMLDQLAWALELIISSPTEDVQKTYPHVYLLFEDDASLHPKFADELAKTIAGLPSDWKLLHLCIGYLWGRNHRPKNGTFKLRPDGMLGEVVVKAGVRYFSHWPDRFATAGSPIAIAIRTQAVAQELKEIVLATKKLYIETTDTDAMESVARAAITDVMFANMAYKEQGHFVTATPQLCWEDDLNGQVI